MELDNATIGIITALPKELSAVRLFFDPVEEKYVPGDGSGRKYLLGKVKSRNGGQHIASICLLTHMGESSAAMRAALMLEHCKAIKYIIMTGIAGGVPSPQEPVDHVRLGDIVVCDAGGVIQYDYGKNRPGKFEIRHLPRPPSALLIETIRHLQADELLGLRPWDDYIERVLTSGNPQWQRPPGRSDVLRDVSGVEVPHPADPGRSLGKPRVFCGPIASANSVQKDPAKRDELREQYKVRAVEMEGSGVADATWQAGRDGYLVIRGICDYCDTFKNDDWQLYAALVAAAYTRVLVESIPTSPLVMDEPVNPDTARTNDDVRKPISLLANTINIKTLVIQYTQGDNSFRSGPGALAVGEDGCHLTQVPPAEITVPNVSPPSPAEGKCERTPTLDYRAVEAICDMISTISSYLDSYDYRNAIEMGTTLEARLDECVKSLPQTVLLRAYTLLARIEGLKMQLPFKDEC